MSIPRSIRRIYYAAGRLLDFSGTYNAALWQDRLATPGWLRDRQAFSQDGRMIAQDMHKAAQRLEIYYAHKGYEAR